MLDPRPTGSSGFPLTTLLTPIGQDYGCSGGNTKNMSSGLHSVLRLTLGYSPFRCFCCFFSRTPQTLGCSLQIPPSCKVKAIEAHCAQQPLWQLLQEMHA